MPSEVRLVLIVDDESNIAHLTAAFLEGAGFETRVALSAEEALEICAALPAPPILLIADVVMPGASGPELFLELATRHQVKRCLFTSGFPSECLGQLRGLEYQVLAKPYSRAELLAAVERTLHAANRRADLLEQNLRMRATAGDGDS